MLGDEEKDAPRRKRQRVQYSCSECHRRKQKCDRGAPCGSCVARKAPHLCLEYRPGYDALSTDGRIARLESAVDSGIEQVLQRLDAIAAGQRESRPAASAAGPSSHARPQPSRKPTGGTLANGSGAKREADFDPLQMVTLSYDAARNTYASLRKHLYPDPADEAEEAHLAETSRLAASAQTLIDDLPASPDRSCALIEHFYRTVNPLHMALPRKRLEPALKALVRDRGRLERNLHQFAILAAILSLAIITAPVGLLREPNEPETRFAEARSLVDAVHLALLTANTFQSDDLDKVMAWVLLSRVHGIEERTQHAWEAATSALRSSYAMGLHRERPQGAKARGSSSSAAPRSEMLMASSDDGDENGDGEDEVRRQVWAMCLFQERSLSLALNRPSMASDAMHTTKPPKGYSNETRDRLDSDETRVLSNAYYHSLALLMGRVNDVVQRTDGHSLFDQAEAIDEEIDIFRRSMDPFLGPFSTDVNELVEAPTLASEMLHCHRWVLHAELDALRIALHRPFLSPTSVGCRQSRAASIQASWDSLARRSKLVFTFQKRYGSGTTPRSFLVLINQSQRFSMVLACCISLLINPRDGDALKLREVIGRYLELMPKRTSRYIREGDHRRTRSLERETRILELFLDQADRLAALIPDDPSSLTPPKEGQLQQQQQQQQQQRASLQSQTLTAGLDTSMTMDQTNDVIKAFFRKPPPATFQHSSALAVPTAATRPMQRTQQEEQEYNPFAMLMRGQADEAQLQSSLVEALCAGMNWSTPSYSAFGPGT